jgi:uncharacterized protein YeaO (DUF488 family)
MLSVKRIYEPPAKDDGIRILVDRLWPRGLSKKKAMIDLWLKEIAPGDSLRKWFGHDPKKWDEFKKRYFDELKNNPAVNQLKDYMKKGRVTLLYSARDNNYNNAVALKEFLQKHT